MNKKKDNRLFEELVFCKDCVYLSSSYLICENMVYIRAERTPYKPIICHPYIEEVNKNNDCKEFLKKEEVVLKETFFEKLYNRFKSMFN
jgi:hypothetical protein